MTPQWKSLVKSAFILYFQIFHIYLINSKWDVSKSTVFWRILHEFSIYCPKLLKFICEGTIRFCNISNIHSFSAEWGKWDMTGTTCKLFIQKLGMYELISFTLLFLIQPEANSKSSALSCENSDVATYQTERESNSNSYRISHC